MSHGLKLKMLSVGSTFTVFLSLFWRPLASFWELLQFDEFSFLVAIMQIKYIEHYPNKNSKKVEVMQGIDILHLK